MIHYKFIYILGIAFFINSCSVSNANNKSFQSPKTNKSPNILLIIADDLGSDAFSLYNIGAEKPNMPNIENLANNGVRFNNVWAYPLCSPTRASIITGKHSFRTNVTQVGDVLQENEMIIQKLIDEKTHGKYSSAVIGKWHLSEDSNHPNDMGLKHFSGIMRGGVRDYSAWRHVENGEISKENKYITSKFTDLAIDWVNKQEKPWFLWLAYTAPHKPFHLPPTDLHSSDNLTNTEEAIKSNPRPYFFSMIEAMDTEIGRLLKAIPKKELDNTVIIFIGDNGSPNKVAQTYGRRKAKGSIYQGGINVPLIVTGSNVKRVNEVENALINSTDLFATIADLAGTGVEELNDSKSIVPLFSKRNMKHKDYLYSELANRRKKAYAIRNSTHKYIKYETGSEELYNLTKDSFEKQNLINDTNSQTVKKELIEKVSSLRKSKS